MTAETLKALVNFKVLNWNIAGAKFLELSPEERREFRVNLNDEIKKLVKQEQPDVVTLQEIVIYEEDKKNILDTIDGYDYFAFPLIDTENLSIRAKWNKLERVGGWPKGTYFAQGNGFMFKKNIPHQPVWALPKDGSIAPEITKKREVKHYIEKVGLESGLYFGDRDTEPRAALVAHFVYTEKEEAMIQDIFVINLHLSTLTKEREGIPEIDKKATKIRLAQLEIVFDGIISRYNSWKRWGFRERDEHRDPLEWESFRREEPVWIITGDFNATPESHEYRLVQDLNFMDMIPMNGKGSGTKSSGSGKDASLTLDYIFAGPKFVSLDPLITAASTSQNKVFSNVRVSDHLPMVATIKVWRSS